MLSRKILLAAAFAVCAAPAIAQPAAPSLKVLASSADVQALIAQARAELKPGQPFVAKNIVTVAPYRVNLEFRTPAAPPTMHVTDAELVYVVEGSGTIITGGTLVDARNTNPTNLAGSAIANGTNNVMNKGDFLFLPEGTNHWIRANATGDFVLMTLHVPRPVAWGTPATPAPAR